MELTETLQQIGLGPQMITFIVAMLPVFELRGAIPVGVLLGLPVWKAAVISLIGNMLPVPFIIAFVRVVFNWIRAHIKWLAGFVDRMEAKAEKNREKIMRGIFWGLLIFVAIPLPGTGAWTGAMIAALLDIRMSRALPSICVGVLIAGIIITLATAGVIQLVV